MPPLLAAALLLAAPADRPPKLFALIVADTDSDLGPSVAKDRDNLGRILREAFATRPHRLELRFLQGKDATRDAVLAHYRDVAPAVRPADTLLCYYSGHGATFPAAGGHALTTHHDAEAGRRFLLRAELRAAMLAAKPRHAVILTDCCTKVPAWAKGVTLAAPPPATWPLIDTLFFHHSGVTDVNGCQDDAFSLSYADDQGDKGGTFTLALVPLLCTNRPDFGKVFGATDGFVSWEQFSARLRADTDGHYQNLRKTVLGDGRADEKTLADVTGQPKQVPAVHAAGAKAPQPVADKTWMLGVEYAAARQGDRPVLVLTKVYPKTPAAAAGLEAGDVLAEVDGVAVAAPADAARLIENSGGRVRLGLRRALQTVSADVDLKPVKPPAPKQP